MNLQQFLFESKKSQINDFISFVKEYLKLSDTPKIMIIDDPEFSVTNKTFGAYELDNNTIKVQTAQRHLMDICRTLAHELAHYKQRKSGMELNGEDGSDDENEANATAAVILRKYSKKIKNHGY
jgi:hypothetical protein